MNISEKPRRCHPFSNSIEPAKKKAPLCSRKHNRTSCNTGPESENEVFCQTLTPAQMEREFVKKKATTDYTDEADFHECRDKIICANWWNLRNLWLLCLAIAPLLIRIEFTFMYESSQQREKYIRADDLFLPHSFSFERRGVSDKERRGIEYTLNCQLRST